VDLLTLEVQSYGEESLVGAKVVERVAVGVPPQPAAGAMMGPPVRPPAAPVQPALPLLAPTSHIPPSRRIFLTPVVAHSLKF